MTAIWLDLPVGTQRVLQEAADQCHMKHEAFIRMLLVEAADYLLEREPGRKHFDLRRSWGFTRDPEESNQGGAIEEQYPQTSTRQKDREGARTVNRGGRSLATDKKKRVRKAANCP